MNCEFEFSEFKNVDPDNYERYVIRGNGAPSFVLTLHYDKLTMRNKYGHEMNVYDTFVRLYFNDLGYLRNMGSAFLIKRTSFTMRQMLYGYVHSHPPSSIAMKQFGSVCLGDGPLSALYGRWMTNGSLSDTEFKSFIFGIKSFLEWEDLHSSTYDKISYILKKQLDVRKYDVKSFIQELIIKDNISIMLGQNDVNISVTKLDSLPKVKIPLTNDNHYVLDAYKDLEGLRFKFKDKVFKYKLLLDETGEDIHVADKELLEQAKLEIKRRIYQKLRDE